VTDINYLNDNDKKSKLDNLLLSYNLNSTVHFPTRMHNNSIMTVFIDKVNYENYSIHPVVNRLSDHDAQIITINNITVDKYISKTESVRKFNEFFDLIYCTSILLHM
jgi:hypothetical protein